MDTSTLNFYPIGHIKTCYTEKNGTPRQPSVSLVSKGELTISKSVFNNPNHSLEGLNQFSHLWIMFVFHLNDNKCVKSKVKPPRMNGMKTGVFSTRSPHRPNPIGLTLAKIESINHDTVYLSGLDIVDGTPVIDIKPFIPNYDLPNSCISVSEKTEVSDIQINDFSECTEMNRSETTTVSSKMVENNVKGCCSKNLPLKQSTAKIASWIAQPPIPQLSVLFSNRALQNIAQFKECVSDTNIIETQCTDKCNGWSLIHIKPNDLKQAIFDTLAADPRSRYRREKCSDKLYYFTIDNAHVTAWFDHSTSPHSVEVLRVIPKHMVDV